MKYLKPLWLIKSEMRIQQINANYDREMELNKKMSPELLKIDIEMMHKKKNK